MGPDFKLSIQEAHVAVESAIAAAEIVAQCEITESQAFNQMMIFLMDASTTLGKVLEAQAVEARIFPNIESARSAVQRLPRVDGAGFEFVRDGAGRCTVKLERVL
jgi:uncharacterized protein YtpQ (UPF0354 family)